MEIGIKNATQIKVEEKDTALTYGSGTLRVFATPAMIALMENTAMNAVSPYLEEGETTVGTEINIKHLSATPVGGTVTCESELIGLTEEDLYLTLKLLTTAVLSGKGLTKGLLLKRKNFSRKPMIK